MSEAGEHQWPHKILTDQLTLGQRGGQIMPITAIFAPTPLIFRPSYGPAAEMMLINNVKMLIEMQWGMLTGFQNTLFLMHCRSILLPGGTAVLLHFTCVQK